MYLFFFPLHLHLFEVLSTKTLMAKTKVMVSITLYLLSLFLVMSFGELQVGFYSKTCPEAETIISRVVTGALLSDPTIPAVLLRLHFHDCFVEGCDGSILVNNGADSERNAFGHQGVRGFETIEAAKAQLEAVCPGVVSCSDIVALAARDSISLANGPAYEVPTGRRDGRVSNLSLASDMPDIDDSVQEMKSKFMRKGLNAKDLVLLSAAHTIGTTACFFMTKRLYSFLPGGGPDPTINPVFLPELVSRCPRNGDINARLPIDHFSERRFDKQILQNIRQGFAVLQSDARLYEDEMTRRVVDSYFGLLNPIFGPFFEADFVESMVKMGRIGVKTGRHGEIRRVCSAFN
ncbi:PREDICTED: peroxidase 43 [Tarenaya hassleriana]|uniref:peroxidase 43 n=1 Tax=Tarenaya hassleriana TaxID=28532 RepID=UPI00053C4C77|nr:PREDICTED: peroxidase 43 [Tarenaya hassleriana]